VQYFLLGQIFTLDVGDLKVDFDNTVVRCIASKPPKSKPMDSGQVIVQQIATQHKPPLTHVDLSVDRYLAVP